MKLQSIEVYNIIVRLCGNSFKIIYMYDKKQIEYKYTCTSGTPLCEYVMIPMLQYSCKDGIIHDRLRDDTVYVADSVSGVHLRDNSQCSVLVSQSVNIDSQSSLY